MRLSLTTKIICCLVAVSSPSLCWAANINRPDLAKLWQNVQAAPASDLAHYKLANALLSSGQKDSAIAEYRKAYELSRTAEMARDCQKVLVYYHLPLPNLQQETLQRRIDRAILPEATFGTINEFASLASSRGKASRDSHPEGVTVFQQCPEIGGSLGEQWHKWNEDFRIAFETRVRQHLHAMGIPAIYGRTKLIFSLDKNRHLKSRIVESTMPEIIWAPMLETTRAMEGTKDLDFPRGTAVDGFNFTIGWTCSNPPPIVQQRIIALMRSNRVNATVLPGQGLNGTALQLRSQQTAAQINSLNGRILPGEGLQGQMLGLSGKPNSNGDAGPRIDAEVSAKLVPKAKEKELKASAGKL